MAKSKNANTKQRKWMSDIAEFASDQGLYLIYGDKYHDSPFELHHALGRSAKHNKVAIGHWFIIPVPTELHKVLSDHPDNVTHFKHRFTDRFGSQRSIFDEMYAAMCVDGYAVPPDEVHNAIMDTRA